MFLKINSSLPIHIIYQERLRVSKILGKCIAKKNNDIKFPYLYNNKIKGKCTKEELNIYLNYLDKQLYIPNNIYNKIK